MTTMVQTISVVEEVTGEINGHGTSVYRLDTGYQGRQCSSVDGKVVRVQA